MDVLLVAPDNGLPGAANEVRAVSMALHCAPLAGHVTRKDLIDALSGRSWDALWFATHGDQHGVALSDGAVSIADLTAIARNSGAGLIVLNSCSSRYVGLEIHYELGVDVICTEAAADDVSAYQTGAFLARNLAQGMDVAAAYERSRPGQGALYHLFTAHDAGEREHLATIKLINDGFRRVEEKISAVEQAIGERIEAIDRRVLAVESASLVLQRRSTPAIDRLMILLMAGVMAAMFLYNVMGAGH